MAGELDIPSQVSSAEHQLGDPITDINQIQTQILQKALTYLENAAVLVRTTGSEWDKREQEENYIVVSGTDEAGRVLLIGLQAWYGNKGMVDIGGVLGDGSLFGFGLRQESDRVVPNDEPRKTNSQLHNRSMYTDGTWPYQAPGPFFNDGELTLCDYRSVLQALNNGQVDKEATKKTEAVLLSSKGRETYERKALIVDASKGQLLTSSTNVDSPVKAKSRRFLGFLRK